MTGQLQTFDHQESPYERPNQKWVCGRIVEGQPCHLGPDRRGVCRTVGACQPTRAGDRWVCCRSQSAGGPCAPGPFPDGRCGLSAPPCQPVRSVRSRRALVARGIAALAVGFLVLALGTRATTLLSPGTLSTSHAELGSCGKCHQNFLSGPVGWLHAAFSGIPAANDGSSARCLSCHTFAGQPLAAHNLPPDEMKSLKARAVIKASVREAPLQFQLASAVFSSPMDKGGGIACASCHREHQGSRADLTAVSNARCQSCHALKFSSLSKGHPAFHNFLSKRRTRINFDHVAHVRKHFPEARQRGLTPPETCADCHVNDARGENNVLRGFDRACATCHVGEIRGQGIAGAAGIPIFAVPGLDLETLRERGFSVGEWPAISDRKMPPIMVAVLAGDKDLTAELKHFLELDPLDLRKASDADLKSVVAVAWATKEFFYDLATEGQAPLRGRLSESLQANLSEATLRDLLGGIALDVVAGAQREWFPSLASDIALHRAGKPVPMAGERQPAAATSESTDSSKGGSALAPSTGQSDILSGDQSNTQSKDQGGILSGDQSDILTKDQGGILSGDQSDTQSKDQGDILSGNQSDTQSKDQGGILSSDQSDTQSKDQGDILSGDQSDTQSKDQGGILSGDQSDTQSKDQGGILSGDQSDTQSKDQGGILSSAPEGQNGVKAAAAPKAGTAKMPEVDPEAWARHGGWYRDFYALLFRPHDHKDLFMRRWLDISGRSNSKPEAFAGSLVFEQFADKSAPGKCTKCHSVDREADGWLRVNWLGRQKDTAYRGFTSFAHAPHFVVLRNGEGCATCHVLNPDAPYEAAFEGRDPTQFASSFLPPARGICASCHEPNAAGDNCTLCHNYHVGRIETLMPKTKIEVITKE
jgi:Fibrinogen binding protein/Doubled CXXCH motif (Paired_CXXCH_1)